MWGSIVELFQAAIFGAAHVCGGSLGAGILVISAAIRIALLPLTLRMARQMNAQQARIAALQPELKRLQQRYETNPVKLATATQALYEANGIRPFSPAMLLNFAVQAPIFGAFFAALRRGDRRRGAVPVGRRSRAARCDPARRHLRAHGGGDLGGARGEHESRCARPRVRAGFRDLTRAHVEFVERAGALVRCGIGRVAAAEPDPRAGTADGIDLNDFRARHESHRIGA